MKRVIETDLIYRNGFHFLTIKVQGVLTGAIVGAGMEALDAYEEYGAGIPVLWDLREADLSQYTTAEMEITNTFLRRYPGRRNTKSASVVGDRGALLLARLWAVYGTDRMPQERRAFLKQEEALAWLAAE
jgi:hypothetical protein|tara:strand:- start:115 stop:504 length:390 start_codon:yes stop_codon:yes gene_type:complete